MTSVYSLSVGLFRTTTDRTYRKSQSETTVAVRISDVTRDLVVRLLDVGDDPKERQAAGQLLIDDLSAAAGLTPCAIVIADRPQVHSHDGQRLQSKTYGYYRCWSVNGRVDRARIRIYNRTAVRQQVIKPKVLLNTLLHEWVHHYDFAGLRMARSPHTSGFYSRLRSLADALRVSFVLPPEPPPR